MERRIVPGAEIMPGVTLQTATMGGYRVNFHGTYIGLIHCFGSQWKATLRVPADVPRSLGYHSNKISAVEAIITIHADTGAGPLTTSDRYESPPPSELND